MAFAAADSDGSGTIDVDELEMLVKVAGVQSLVVVRGGGMGRGGGGDRGWGENEGGGREGEQGGRGREGTV